jgi:Flp pilus assembly pilin Flp
MKTLANKIKALWNDESAQGATEYILLIVIVVGLAMMFKTQITNILKDKLSQIGSAIGGFNPEG